MRALSPGARKADGRDDASHPFLPRLPAWASLPSGLSSGERPRLGRWAARFGALVLAAAALLFLVHTVSEAGGMPAIANAALGPDTLAWLAAHPAAGATLFASVEAAAVVVMVPASLFCLLAGALFGALKGAAVGWTGLVVGQTAAFALGRTLLRARVAAWLAAAPPRWATLDAALSRGAGWRLVALLRLSPALPWNALNIALAATSVRFAPYTLASAAAVAPWVALFAYAGSLAASLADVVEGRAGPTGPAALAAAAAGAAATAAGASYAVLLARRAMADEVRGEGGAAERAVVDTLASDAETRESEGGGVDRAGDLELGPVSGRP